MNKGTEEICFSIINLGSVAGRESYAGGSVYCGMSLCPFSIESHVNLYVVYRSIQGCGQR
jgi:NADP-dependent 3-hydroxy acid dehydrogenase YdfG